MITYRFNAQTKQAEIIKDGQVIEVCTLSQVASRLQALRYDASKKLVTVSCYKKDRNGK